MPQNLGERFDVKLRYFDSLEEQKRVAYLLSIYDDRIAKEEQLLSELEAMRKGLLQQLFI